MGLSARGTYIVALARDSRRGFAKRGALDRADTYPCGSVKLEQCLDPAKFAEWIDQQDVEISD